MNMQYSERDRPSYSLITFIFLYGMFRLPVLLALNSAPVSELLAEDLTVLWFPISSTITTKRLGPPATAFTVSHRDLHGDVPVHAWLYNHTERGHHSAVGLSAV